MKGEVSGSALAKTLDLVRLDSFPRRRFEPHHIVTITEQDAGHGNCRRPICCRGTELLTTTLVMHVPVHEPKWRDAKEIALIWINVCLPSLQLECADLAAPAVQGSFCRCTTCFTTRGRSVGGEHDGPALARVVFEIGDITRIGADDRSRTVGGRVIPTR